MSKDYDLFDFFDRMNKGDFDHVDKMTDEEVKKLSPYVLLMWTRGAKNPQTKHIHVILTSLYCSDKVYTLAKHPRLLLKLFIAANCDIDNTRYSFMKQNRVHDKSLKMIADFYDVTLSDAEEYKRLLSVEDITELQKFYENKE
ncbi:hypothetical protein [Alishewanella phage vB_AspM_Slickus01]|nr:hypothetical protein [Alishewanella phage vB_AspM_Slickus01]